MLGGTPVITTATDVQGLPALDTLAAGLGLVIENLAAVKEVSMALLEGTPVGLVDPGGWLAPALGEHRRLFHEIAGLDAALAGAPPAYGVCG